jgi:2-polyprenyl-6-hydroxyphenyl methylase/3-demethylubiquinone-9 3-methyltransferase
MVNFTPEGLFSDFLDALAPYSPAPAGTQSPALWGSEEHVRELFADRVDFLELARRTYVEGAPSPGDYVELFRQTFGPVVALYRSLADDPGRSAALDHDFLEFATHADSGPSGGPAEYRYEYLLVLARKRPAAS